MQLTPETLVDIAMTNPVNVQIVSRLPSLGLSQCILTAGCLFQAVWNHQSGLSPAAGVKDYDIFYFDTDLSWEAENEVILETQHLFKDLGVKVDIKNQARVHLWYGERFGRVYPALLSARDGVDRYLVAGTCIGFDPETGEVYAPYGLDDVGQGLLRPNPLNLQPDLFVPKARSYQARWPWLRIWGAARKVDGWILLVMAFYSGRGNCMLIVFSGLPGTGKTTIARGVAANAGAVYHSAHRYN